MAEIIGYYCFQRTPDIETTAGWDALDYTSSGLILPIVIVSAQKRVQQHRLAELAVESAIVEQQPRIKRTVCKTIINKISAPFSISFTSGIIFFLLLANYLQKVIFRRETTDPMPIDLIEQAGVGVFFVLGPAILLNALLYLAVAYKEKQLCFTVAREEEPEPSTSMALLVRSEHIIDDTIQPLYRPQQPSSFSPVHTTGCYARSIPVGNLSLLSRIKLYRMCDPDAVRKRMNNEAEHPEETAVTWGVIAMADIANATAVGTGLSIN